MKRQRTRADELDAFIDAIPRTGQPAIDAETTRAAEALRALAEATSPRAEFVSDLEERLLGTGQERGRVLPFGAARGAAPPPPPLLTTARAADGRTGPRAPGRLANRGVRARLVAGANRVASVAAVAVLLAVLASALVLVLPTMQRGGGGSSGGSGTAPTATPATPAPPAGLPQEMADRCWAAGLWQDAAGLPPDKRALIEREMQRCATAQALPTVPKTPIPPSPPRQTPTTAPATLTAVAQLRPCRADDLVVVWEYTNGAAGGTLVGSLLFGNRSATPCQLTGRPGLQLFDAQGQPLRLRLGLCNPPRPLGPFPCTPDRPVPLPPGGQLQPRRGGPGQARVGLLWNGLKPDGSGPCARPWPTAVEVRVVLPEDGGDLPVAIPAGEDEALGTAACGGSLWVSSFN